MLALAGCATAPASATLNGSVVAGPTCPVERADRPCPPRPVPDLTVTAQGNGITKSTRTDSRGHFSLKLSPGTYELSATARGVMQCDDQRVQVAANRDARVTIDCDTGIR